MERPNIPATEEKGELSSQFLTSDRIGTGDVLRLGFISVQLVLVLLVIYRYQLESRTFFNVMALGFAGFVVHAILPLQYRLTFFVILSLAAILVAFGPIDGGWLLLLGLVLIGICHLPLRLAARVLLLLLTGAVFALWRLEILPGPWSVAIWPILGAMFMFRLALYLHALKHDEKRPTLARTLAYFFMLPNVCFPLFPVVDYLTFRRTYYDRNAYEIYGTGIKWIVRGLVHLLLYRVVYVHLAGDAMELHTLGDLVQFLLATFLLYLRVSGQFHLICGVLYLFGFRLPETHHLYFLSSSFTDFWRRINIYWKDFMMKLVYYPSFFALKKYGPKLALVAATGIVFLGTWLLHSYQWFWLRGGFPLEPQDGLFWGTLGALVMIGAVRELKRSRRRKLGGTAGWNLGLALHTVGTFTAICVLWSLWSAESIVTWLLMWGAAGTTSARELVVLGVLLLVCFAIAGWAWQSSETKASMTSSSSRLSDLGPVLSLIGILALSMTQAYAPVAPEIASVVASVQRSTLNARDAALQHRGYYENLDNASRMSAQLWDVNASKPAHWVSIAKTGAYHGRHDFIGGELRPNADIIFNDQRLTTNSWGMRDRERTLEKPAGVYRIALVGPSHVMGSGVSDANTFARFLEERLNRQEGTKNGTRYEVLNFGVLAYALTQQLGILEERVLKFQPDTVLFFDSSGMAGPIIGHLLHTLSRQYEIPFSKLNKLLDETGVTALGRGDLTVPYDVGRAALTRLGLSTRMPWAEADLRLRRSADRLVRVTFEEMAEIVRKHGAVPVFVALDIVIPRPKREMPGLPAAANAGMLVFDMLDLWQVHDADALRVAPWDNHANAAGNRLIAERLYEDLHKHAHELRMDRPVGSASSLSDSTGDRR